MCEDGITGPCNLLQHHIGRTKNSNTDPKLPLHCLTDLRRGSLGNKQLYQPSLVEQHPKPYSPEPHFQSNPIYEGRSEHATELYSNPEPNSSSGTPIIHSEVSNQHQPSIHPLDCSCKPALPPVAQYAQTMEIPHP